MYVIVMFVGLVSLVSGLVLHFVSRRYRKPDAPTVSSWNPRSWGPWRIHEWYTAKGVRLHYISLLLILIGAVLYIMAEGVKPLFGG